MQEIKLNLYKDAKNVSEIQKVNQGDVEKKDTTFEQRKATYLRFHGYRPFSSKGEVPQVEENGQVEVAKHEESRNLSRYDRVAQARDWVAQTVSRTVSYLRDKGPVIGVGVMLVASAAGGLNAYSRLLSRSGTDLRTLDLIWLNNPSNQTALPGFNLSHPTPEFLDHLKKVGGEIPPRPSSKKQLLLARDFDSYYRKVSQRASSRETSQSAEKLSSLQKDQDIHLKKKVKIARLSGEIRSRKVISGGEISRPTTDAPSHQLEQDKSKGTDFLKLGEEEINSKERKLVERSLRKQPSEEAHQEKDAFGGGPRGRRLDEDEFSGDFPAYGDDYDGPNDGGFGSYDSSKALAIFMVTAMSAMGAGFGLRMLKLCCDNIRRRRALERQSTQNNEGQQPDVNRNSQRLRIEDSNSAQVGRVSSSRPLLALGSMDLHSEGEQSAVEMQPIHNNEGQRSRNPQSLFTEDSSSVDSTSRVTISEPGEDGTKLEIDQLVGR
jgi:hypothetical protein